MNFLVTGGAGFIGSHVCERLLRDGHKVWAFDDLNNFYDPKFKQRNLKEIQAIAGGRAAAAAHRRRGSAAATQSGLPFEFVRGDITERAALDEIFSSVKFDQVIHLAARAGVRPSLADPALYQRVNVEGTVNVLEAARTHRVKKITIASSSSVYGMNSKTPFAESDPIFSAVSPYAASKLACEALGHVWHHIYKMDVAMLRFFTVYGPRQRPDLVIYKFAKLISAGKPISVFGDGTAARDYTFITDTLDGIIACTQREFGYELFNLGESQTIKLNDLIKLLEKLLGKTAVIDRQPVQPGDVPITFADISKARAKLGYHPQVKIEQGLPKFVDWFLKSNG
ncbi:MAG TPA: GDP-mannose 4,6-dehydratase [Verrucomicrobiae bacterium]|nr:GDP-mannose 4,6-dehydratase [Verrucomicrobiae bacterium]